MPTLSQPSRSSSCRTLSADNDIYCYSRALPLPLAWSSPCEDLHDDRQSTHERTLRGGRFVTSFLTRYVSLSFHPPFSLARQSTWSICIGACHACTASQCDLRDPGWGDPGFRHCDFFALAPIGPSGVVLGFFCFQRMACSVRGTQVAR